MPHVTTGPFSIDAPRDWTITSCIFMGPLSQPEPADPQLPPFRRNIVITREIAASGETAESYLNRQIYAFTQAGISVDEKEPVKLASGLDGFITEAVVLGIGGMRLRQMYLFCVDKEFGFSLVATHLDGEPFEMVRDELRNVLLSFKPVPEHVPLLQSS